MIAVAESTVKASPGRHHHALNLAREVLRTEASAVAQLAHRIDTEFADALDLLLGCGGRVIVVGIGKSGHIARKVAAPSPRPVRRHSLSTRRRRATVI